MLLSLYCVISAHLVCLTGFPAESPWYVAKAVAKFAGHLARQYMTAKHHIGF